MLVSRGAIGRAAARRQGQLHILHICILGHVSPVGGHGGSEGLVGVASLLVSQSFLHQDPACRQNMQKDARVIGDVGRWVSHMMLRKRVWTYDTIQEWSHKTLLVTWDRVFPSDY